MQYWSQSWVFELPFAPFRCKNHLVGVSLIIFEYLCKIPVKEETLTMMKTALRSKNLKTMVDVLVQTESATQISESCQTEQGTDFEVQVNLQPDKNTMVTQTIKKEV